MLPNSKTKWRVVQTVLGKMDSNLIGFCQCHEHLFIEKGKPFEVNNTLYMDDINKSIAELRMYNNSGGITLVDAQPVGCGRMAENLKKASKISGVSIVATTGFHKLIFYKDDHWIFRLNENELTALYIKEIKESMIADGNNNDPEKEIDCQAVIIKVALESCGIKGDYEKLFEAVANAAFETGAPIMIHTEKGADVWEAIRFFENKKINESAIIICHLDRTNGDLNYHKEIIKSGAFLEYDTIGRFKYHSDEKEIEFISSLVSGGFEDHLLLGLDSTNERLKSYGGRVGLDYINTTFIPKLKEHRISDEIIKKLTIDNPKRALSMKY